MKIISKYLKSFHISIYKPNVPNKICKIPVVNPRRNHVLDFFFFGFKERSKSNIILHTHTRVAANLTRHERGNNRSHLTANKSFWVIKSFNCLDRHNLPFVQ